MRDGERIRVQQYRNRLEIIGDVLSVVLTSSGEGGASASVMMRRSNLSYRSFEQLLSQLLSAGFITQKQEKKRVRYVASAKGCDYLAHYHEFARFAESYGVRL